MLSAAKEQPKPFRSVNGGRAESVRKDKVALLDNKHTRTICFASVHWTFGLFVSG